MRLTGPTKYLDKYVLSTVLSPGLITLKLILQLIVMSHFTDIYGMHCKLIYYSKNVMHFAFAKYTQFTARKFVHTCRACKCDYFSYMKIQEEHTKAVTYLIFNRIRFITSSIFETDCIDRKNLHVTIGMPMWYSTS